MAMDTSFHVHNVSLLCPTFWCCSKVKSRLQLGEMQLKKHLYEFFEDGVRDFLAHASSIKAIHLVN